MKPKEGTAVTARAPELAAAVGRLENVDRRGHRMVRMVAVLVVALGVFLARAEAGERI